MQEIIPPEIIDFDEEIPGQAVKSLKKPAIKRKPQMSIEEQTDDKPVKVTIGKDFLNDYGPQMNYAFKLWKKNSEVLGRAAIDGDFAGNPMEWNVENVCSFIRRVVEDVRIADKFREHEIDGAAFVSMCQNDLTDLMEIKLGAAIKIYNRIMHLRQEIMLKFVKI